MLDQPTPTEGEFDAPCFRALSPGAGTSTHALRSPAYGYLRISLEGGEGDWDLAAFSTDRVVGAGASPGPDEVVTGYALKDERIEIQVCRNPGATGEPTVRAELDRQPYPGGESSEPELLRVATPERADREALAATGFDTSEGVGPGYTEVVGFGRRERRALERAGLSYEIAGRDLGARTLREQRDAGRGGAEAGELPSGRQSYRRLFNYEQEIKDLAAAHPDLVRIVTLPEPTYEGRPVFGIELGDNPGLEEGEPVFLQMGLHHGREWPSGELALEWAYELLDSAAAGSVQAQHLLADTTTMVVPVVNPDGFNVSRESGQLRVDFGVRSGDEHAGILPLSEEFQRKNCRLPRGGAVGDCGRISRRYGLAGVDVNRNYGGQWGGIGGGMAFYDETYRGPAPFSEPEARNVRSIFASNQVTASSTNHTYAALILRPPNVEGLPRIPDAGLYRRLGARMGAHTGYPSVPGTDLYSASGVTEGWSYYTAGSITYTPEIGTRDFHPPFAGVIREWNGATGRAGGGGGMRAATYEVAAFAGNPGGHAVVRGRALPGGRILFRKGFETKTQPVLGLDGRSGPPLRFKEALHTAVDVGPDGTFSAALTPSTRPIVEQRTSGPRRETWKLICLDASGRRTGERRLYADRGDEIELDLSAGC